MAGRELLLRQVARHCELELPDATACSLPNETEQANRAALHANLLRKEPLVRWPPTDGQPDADLREACWQNTAMDNCAASCMKRMNRERLTTNSPNGPHD